MQRLFLSALALSLCGCGSAYCAPALSLAPTRPMILVRRTSPLLACATNEPPEQHAKIVASPSSNAATAWIEQNLLQGVNLNPSPYAVMVVYFVQGVLGLASLARTYFSNQPGSSQQGDSVMGIHAALGDRAGVQLSVGRPANLWLSAQALPHHRRPSRLGVLDLPRHRRGHANPSRGGRHRCLPRRRRFRRGGRLVGGGTRA